MQTQTVPPCPRCGQADAVHLVREVVSGMATSGPVAQVAPDIRQQLAPPTLPEPPQKSDFPTTNYRIKSAGTGKRTLGGTLDGLLLVAWLVLSFIAFLLAARIDGDLVEYTGTGIALVLLLILFGFRQLVLKRLPIASLREYYRLDAQEDADTEQRAQAAYQAALAAYEQRRRSGDKWHNLRYCARCNGVFDPQEGVFVPVAQMQTYLNPAPGPIVAPSGA